MVVDEYKRGIDKVPFPVSHVTVLCDFGSPLNILLLGGLVQTQCISQIFN